MTETVTTTRAVTWRSWLGLVILAFPVFMTATDMTVLFLATPSIAEALAPGSTQMLWILHIDQFLTMGLGLMMGRLGVRIGWRRMLIIAVGVYAVASLGAAYSVGPEMLIGFRAVLGIAGGAIMPAAVSLIREMFPDARRFSLAFAVLMNTFPAGMALGPPLGGFLLERFWWGAAFLMNVPLAVVLLLAAPFVLPVAPGGGNERIDLRSVLLTLAGVIPVVWGLQELAQYGIRWDYLAAVLFGLTMLVLFVRRQRRLTDPLLDPRLFAVPAFTFALLVVLGSLGAGGTDMLFAQHLQAVVGLSAAQAGLLLIIPAVTGLAGGMLVPLLTRWMRPAYAIALGLSIGVVGLSVAFVGVGAQTVWIAMVGVTALSIAANIALTAGSELVVTSVPENQTGTATAANDLFGTFGNAMSIALLGSLAAVFYRSGLSGIGDVLPPEAADSVGAGVAAAEQLDGSGAGEALATVRESFTTGLQWAYGVAIVIYLAVIVLTLWKLRHARTAQDTEQAG